jgi:hypothetical protein
VPRYLKAAAILAVMAVLFDMPSAVAQTAPFEGAARGYPVFRDSTGKKLADGEFVQLLKDDQLHVSIVYRFKDDHQIEEKAVFRQRPRLVQEKWSWRETRGGKEQRRFTVDFASRTASATKLEDHELKRWSEKIEVEPGETFAGFGFTMAIKARHEALSDGQTVKLKAIGFTPKPRAVTVEVSRAGVDRLGMAGREITADHFVIHPKLPWIARIFAGRVPDTHIWLTHPWPPAFLRWEGPIAEPSDAGARVDLLPSGESRSAEPQTDSRRR